MCEWSREGETRVRIGGNGVQGGGWVRCRWSALGEVEWAGVAAAGVGAVEGRLVEKT